MFGSSFTLFVCVSDREKEKANEKERKQANKHGH